MSQNQNLGVKKQIIVKGGEMELAENPFVVPIEFLSVFSNKELKTMTEEIDEDIRSLNHIGYKIINGIVIKDKTHDEIKFIKKETERLRARKKEAFKIINKRNRKWVESQRFKVRKLDNFEIKNFRIVNLIPSRLSMITQKAEYEIVKGDNMKENEVIINEYIDESGKTTTDAFVRNVSNKRTGGLKARDLITLHQSGRLVMKRGEEEVRGFKRPIYKTTLELIKEDGFFKFFSQNKEQIKVDIPNFGYLHYQDVARTSFDFSMCQNELAKSFLRNLNGDKHRFSVCKTYNRREREYQIEGLSHNYVDYSVNSIIVIGSKGQIRTLVSKFKNLNSIENGYYEFGENIGLNGLSDLEKQVLKQSKKPKASKNKEAEELLQILEEVETEEELRFELRDLKTRTSSELHFLIKEIEEEPGVEPLLNVLEEIKGRKEIFEEERDCLSFDIKDLIMVEKTKGFKADRKYKNLYNQKLGLLNPNQNPQNMKLETTTSEEVSGFIKYNKLLNKVMSNRFEEEVEKHGMISIEDAKGNEVKIRRNMTVLSFFKGNPSVVFYNKKSPKYDDVSEEEYHHTSSSFKKTGGKINRPSKSIETSDLESRYFEEKIKQYELNRFLYIHQENGEEKKKAPSKRFRKRKNKPVTRRVTNLEVVLEKIRRGNSSSSNPSPLNKEEVIKSLKNKQKEASSNNKNDFKIIKNKGGKIVGIKINGKKFHTKGDINLLLEKKDKMAIVGTRKPCRETGEFINDVVKKHKDCVIVSGLALGCDSIAHYAALRHGAKTIAVLPSGLKNISPKRNIKLANKIIKNGGLIISEYEESQGVVFNKDKNTYFERNYTIAEISDKVLICEAGNGTMNTLNHAKNLNKEILVQMIDNPNNIKIVDDEDGDFLLI